MKRKSVPLERLFAGIEFVGFDFDGVFTDNRVWISEDGLESVVCNRSDGFGIEVLRRAGVLMAIFSSEPNPAVMQRAKKLKLECFHGHERKENELRGFMKSRGIDPEKAAFLGNDRNDIPCFEAVGLPAAVADAHPVARKAAVHVTRASGGCGAVREFCERIARAKRGA